MSGRGRILILTICICIVTTTVLVRLFATSVSDHSEYKAMADDQQNVVQKILPKRGTIWLQDYAGGKTTVAAQSIQRFSVSATPKNVKNKEQYAALLSRLSGTDEAQLLASFKKDNGYMQPFAYGLTVEEVQKYVDGINELERTLNSGAKDKHLSFDSSQGNVLYFTNGVIFTSEYYRVYPENSLLGQAIGFVDKTGKGKYGVEGKYDTELTGFGGAVRMERDSSGKLLRQNGSIEGQDGTSYELSIDRNVQYYIEQALAKRVQDSEAKGGSVVVMDPKTGEIIAMASTPTYDPNNYRTVAQDNISLFDNPVTSKQWEPGSIFKTMVMAAALNEGLVTPDTANDFPASVQVEGHTINTALMKSYGHETMTDVIVNSDNVAMVWVAEKLGNETMRRYITDFGFGATTDVDLLNEIGGKVPELNNWRDINRATMSFGQGIAVTPMQIIAAYAAIANGGTRITPHITKALVRADGTREEVKPQTGSQVVTTKTADEIKQMLTAVVEREHKRAGVDGYKLGGKTGTAQVPNPDGPGYLENQYNHSFAGIGPIDNPRFVILTKIDQPNIEKVGRYAETTAVPLFSEVMNFLLHYYQIPPTNR